MENNVLETFTNTKSRFFQLQNVNIELVPTPLYLATMKCRPKTTSFLFPWKKHEYVISVNSKEKFSRYSIPVHSLNDILLTGWFAHELGHIVQYERMNLIEFITFPFKYFLDLDFRKNFEIEATDIAREVGFKNEFNEVENFLVNDQRVSKKYQERFKRFYVLD